MEGGKMEKIKVVASTHLGHEATKDELDRLAALTAGVCYLKDTTETLFNEPAENTARRLVMIENGGHHSPFDHGSFTLEFVGIPKIVAMILNNEKMYTTSEKSARYKIMDLPEKEQEVYNKWLGIFQQKIVEKYGEDNPYLTKMRIKKLAQENARYMTSVFTPAVMEHTLTYRQFNVLYSMLKKDIEDLQKMSDPFSTRLCSSLQELTARMEELPYLNPKLFDAKGRKLSLIDRRITRPIIKQYGDVYQIAYEGTFAQLAQAQRHRTIDYSFRFLPETKCYIPPIIKDDKELVLSWTRDFESLKDVFPQGMMLEIIEKGTIDNIILKAKERKCTCAQLEIDNQTTASIKEIYQNLEEQHHPAAEDLQKYATDKARCTFGYKCTSPCGFKEGITGERVI